MSTLRIVRAADTSASVRTAESSRWARMGALVMLSLALLVSSASAQVSVELCDGIDNDDDGSVDEDFPQLGEPCLSGIGACAAPGQYICDTDATAVRCNGTPLPPGIEGTSAPSSCSDFADNDCDGHVDFEDSDCTSVERCDGRDNDADGLVDEDFEDVGRACSVGVGRCAVGGTVVCTADGSATRCSAIPAEVNSEGPAGSPSCGDEEDNDCDGLADIDDPDCQAAEECDGIDNDGDGSVDEDFADLGGACTVGVGSCENSGVVICNPASGGTICSAAALPPSVEGPMGASCRDAHDNDCDGLADDLDPDCSSVGLVASCGFEAIATGPCEARYRFTATAASTSGALELSALSLLVLDDTGAVARTIDVRNGQEVRLCRRDGIRVKELPTALIVEAPAVLGQVTASDGRAITRGFCSPVPVLKVVSPDGLSVGDSTGVTNTVDVVVATPNVVPESIKVFLDGVDLLERLAASLPGGPFDGTVDVNGVPITIESLNFDGGASAVTMTIKGLEGGGHIVRTTGSGVPVAVERLESINCERFFSVSAIQYSPGIDTLRLGGIYDSPITENIVERSMEPFLPPTLELSAIAVERSGDVLFTVARVAGVVHSGGYSTLRPTGLYRYSTATGEILPVASLPQLGAASMDAIDRLEDGAFAFSTNELRGVRHAGGFITIRPESVYRFEPWTGALSLLWDGTSLGVRSLDALDVLADGRIVFSTASNEFGLFAGRGVTLYQQDAYLWDPRSGQLQYCIDGRSLGLLSLSGFSKRQPPDFSTLSSRGLVSVLSITIDSPDEGGRVAGEPVRVAGKIVHGAPIAAWSIQGSPGSTEGQTFVPGDGLDVGDKYELRFDVEVEMSNLFDEFATATIRAEQFNPGGNILVVRAADSSAAVAFRRRLFYVGPVVFPEGQSSGLNAGGAQGLPNAFGGLLSERAIRALFDPLCDEAQSQATLHLDQLTDNYALIRRCYPNGEPGSCRGFDSDECPPIDVPGIGSIPGPCIEARQPQELFDIDVLGLFSINCTVGIQARLTGYSFDASAISCQPVLTDGVLEDRVHLPPLSLFGSVDGGCCFVDCLFFCCAGLSVDADFRIDFSESTAVAKITESNLLNGGNIQPEFPADGAPEIDVEVIEDRTEVDGLLGGAFDLFDFVWPGEDPIDDLTQVISSFVIERQLRQKAGELADESLPPINDFEGFGKLGFGAASESAGLEVSALPVEVTIAPTGVRLDYTGGFTPVVVDPDIGLLASVRVGAPPPPPIPPNGADVGAFVSVDALNQLLAAVTSTGKLKLTVDDGRSFSDIGLGGFVSNPLFRAIGITPATMVGLSLGVTVPPRVLLSDDTTTTGVDARIRANDVGFGIIADRDGNGVGATAGLPLCLTPGAPLTGDCLLLQTCVDLNLLGRAEVTAGEPGQPGIRFTADEIQQLARPAALTCYAPRDPSAEEEPQVLRSSASDPSLELLRARLNAAIPELSADHLNFNGILPLVNPSLVAVETDGDFRSQDFLCVAGSVSAR